jgi:membrane protein implicated in regulation of membrane protease activity
MSVLFLTAFISGLILGVYVMMYGVERVKGSLPVRVTPGARYPASPWVPALGGFLAAFGLVGYLVHRADVATLAARVGLAAAAGLLGMLGGRAVVTRWAIPGALADDVDERYLLQGWFAQVVTPIGNEAGQVTYEVDGVAHRAAARTLDGTPIATGTEVVIERIEDGVAWVEPWAQVEQRI